MDYWNNEASLALIEQYKNQPVLWNTKHGYHYSKVRKQEAWETIAYNMQVGVNEVRQKMNSLLGSFRRERSKMRRGERSYAHGHNSRWFALDKMLFLLDRHEDFVPNDNIYLEQLQVKLEEEERDLALDSDSNLLEEELNEASQETSADAKKHAEKLFASPIQPPPSKRLKMTHINSATVQDTTSFSVQNECTAYGHYVASKLTRLSFRTRAFVERAINTVLFEADLGKYDNLPSPFDRKQQTSTTFLSSNFDGINLFPSDIQSIKPIELSSLTDTPQTDTDPL